MAFVRNPIIATVALSTSLLLAACGEASDEQTVQDVSDVDVIASEEPEIIGVRQANFEEMGDAFKPIGATLKSDDPDIEMIGRNAAVISANLQKMPDHFPAGTGVDDGYDTDALAAIWEQPEKYSNLTDKAILAGAGLVEAANSGDLSAVQGAVGALGNACKDCHDSFRAEDD